MPTKFSKKISDNFTKFSSKKKNISRNWLNHTKTLKRKSLTFI